ncbi:hypothetical protein CAPTEDRAFT_223625 [Capitella teleta]|uniref:Peptidase C51 domain-containing protein n=1 Tax=Capitella teleta TaxID=283909 RepID=R7V4S8_CAPTE|nr:hypothetical protein CAPTEDRAFT_223625 [Capitella teleta]|eukprot:ELU10775.1 hypothetical protein CAPTEDRAFT_223625 [Capitella teleta]
MQIFLLLVCCVGFVVAMDYVPRNMEVVAEKYIGSTIWAFEKTHPSTETPANSNKCNLFVADVIEMSGGQVPQRKVDASKKTPIGTGEWCNPASKYMKKVSCWKHVTDIKKDGSGYSLGDVICDDGHMGIVVGVETVASQHANMSINKIVANDWGFRKDKKNPVFWRWICRDQKDILTLDEINDPEFIAANSAVGRGSFACVILMLGGFLFAL